LFVFYQPFVKEVGQQNVCKLEFFFFFLEILLL
jgi:hypothetical protein